jgi:hypothetical protein
MADENKIYPNLPQLDNAVSAYPNGALTNNPQNFRLFQISEIKKFLELEIEFRRKMFRKYKLAFNVCTDINYAMGVISVGSGAVSIPSIVGVLTSPVGLALGGVSIAVAVTSMALNGIKKNLTNKLAKHEKMGTLAASKLNTINYMISKALADSHISTEEFTFIINEKEKYIMLKNAVRKKQRQTNSNGVDVDNLKKTFLEEGQKLAQAETKTNGLTQLIINNYYPATAYPMTAYPATPSAPPLYYS